MKTGRNSNGNVKKSKVSAECQESTGAGSKGTNSAHASAAAAVSLNGKIKAEHYQSDREAFLNAFEKPTQIYRYIRSRTLHSPTFLNRNLSYMKQRMSRNHKRRATFKVDSMLEEAMRKYEAEQLSIGKDIPKNFYNIIILGLSDVENNWAPDTKARVEIQIARICLKKRKEVRVPINKAFEGVCEVKVQSVTHGTNTSSPLGSNHNNNSILNHNNNHLCNSKLCPVISIPSDCFNLVNGHVVRSYVLMVRVSIPKAALVKGTPPLSSSDVNGQPAPQSIQSPKPSTHAPVSKKTASVTHHNNGVIWPVNLKPEDLNPKVIIKQEDQAHAHVLSTTVTNGPVAVNDLAGEEPKAKRRRSAPKDREQFIYTGIGGHRGDSGGEDMIFMGQITIYDKQLSINLGTADYELILRQCQKRRANFSFNRLVTQEATWEILESDHPKIQIFPCSGGGKAKLNVAIRTSAVKMGPYMERPIPVSFPSGCGSHNEKEQENGVKTSPLSPRPTKVIYQFIYNNNSRQQTEAREDLSCPWCSLNCLALYSLLKHLKLCHPRFHFSYVPVASGARIDVSINESFDGSYSGSAYDLVAQPPGEAFARNGPTKRTNIFSILVCRPKNGPPSLLEFQESEEKDVDHRKTFITGHNRLYHHTTTCLPIQPREIDVDSEGEADPEWLQIKTSMMIDEFTDVNEGEKEVMKMWNLHVLKHNYVGDCQIPLACEKFVEYLGRDIIKKNLYRNFVLHLTNLYDFGLLSPQAMYLTIQGLHAQMKDNNTANTLRESWRAHLPSTSPVEVLSAEPSSSCSISSASSISTFVVKGSMLSDLSNTHLTLAPPTGTTKDTATISIGATSSSTSSTKERVTEGGLVVLD